MQTKNMESNRASNLSSSKRNKLANLGHPCSISSYTTASEVRLSRVWHMETPKSNQESFFIPSDSNNLMDHTTFVPQVFLSFLLSEVAYVIKLSWQSQELHKYISRTYVTILLVDRLKQVPKRQDSFFYVLFWAKKSHFEFLLSWLSLVHEQRIGFHTSAVLQVILLCIDCSCRWRIMDLILRDSSASWWVQHDCHKSRGFIWTMWSVTPE